MQTVFFTHEPYTVGTVARVVNTHITVPVGEIVEVGTNGDSTLYKCRVRDASGYTFDVYHVVYAELDNKPSIEGVWTEELCNQDHALFRHLLYWLKK